jgi:Rieske Fe-S protein
MQRPVPKELVDRRGFLTKCAAGVTGAVATMVPIAGSLTVVIGPLLRKSDTGEGVLVPVASLEALPSDGVPRKFSVVADRTDAWNKYPHVPIGAVYLRRTGETKIEALNVVCPHAGGFVDYLPQSNCFKCPLHNSTFALDGSIKDPKSPAARGMDVLPVEIRDGAIWVRFENFQAGIAKKIPA